MAFTLVGAVVLLHVARLGITCVAAQAAVHPIAYACAVCTNAGNKKHGRNE